MLFHVQNCVASHRMHEAIFLFLQQQLLAAMCTDVCVPFIVKRGLLLVCKVIFWSAKQSSNLKNLKKYLKKTSLLTQRWLNNTYHTVVTKFIKHGNSTSLRLTDVTFWICQITNLLLFSYRFRFFLILHILFQLKNSLN